MAQQPPKLTALGELVRTADIGALDLVHRILAAIRQHLDLEVAFVSEFSNGQRIFRAVDTDVPSVVAPGGADPLEASYCMRVTDGRLPRLLTNAQEHVVARELEVTTALPVGGHLSVPIFLSDGTVYGTFCCFSRQARPDLTERDIGVMEVLAGVIGNAIEENPQIWRDTHEWRHRIDLALQQNDIAIALQVIVDLTTRQVVGYEALARFHDAHSSGWSRPPDEWFAAAHAIGRGSELELAAFRSAVALFPSLPEHAFLSVNVAPDVFVTREFSQALASTPIPLPRLVVEITEQRQPQYLSEVVAQAALVRSAGARLAMDDTGAGYSSLTRIVEMSPDIVKLDRLLVHEVHEDLARQALVRSLVAYAEASNACILAEGVETEDEAAALVDLGVPLAQGYLFGRPVPVLNGAD